MSTLRPSPDDTSRAGLGRGAGPTRPAGSGDLGRPGHPGQLEDPGDGARLPLAAALAAVGAVVSTLLPLALVVFTCGIGGGATFSGSIRFTVAAWLLAHGVPLTVGAKQITLIPLLLTGLIVWRLMAAGRRVARAGRAVSLRLVLRAVTLLASAYALLGAVLAHFVSSGGLHLSVLRAGLTLGLVAAVSALAGTVRARMVEPLPNSVAVHTGRWALRTGVVVVLLLTAAGAAVVGLSLALHGRGVAELLGSYQTGILGQAGVVVLCLAYAPNLAVWGAAYLLGPGFAVGTGSVVSPGEVLLGPVPGLPVFAALPSAPLGGGWTVLLALPLLSAVLTGWSRGRRPPPNDRGDGWRSAADAAGGWRLVGVECAAAGLVAGLLLTLVADFTSGGVGAGHLAHLGASDWRLGLITAAVTGVGAFGGAAIRLLGRSRS